MAANAAKSAPATIAQTQGMTMGILDSLENNPPFRSALGQIGAAVLPVVMSEIMGTGNQGGLSAIIAKLEQAGFGDQVKSWIGTGANLPITADAPRQVLGNDPVRQIAAKYNTRTDQAPGVLPPQLPLAVDHASPDGKLPPSA